MKKILILCLLIWQFLISNAQNSAYIPFPSDMIQYGYANRCFSEGCSYGMLRLEIKGDTLINGMHYSKYYHDERYGQSNVNNGFPPRDITGFDKIIGGIRNDLVMKRVYVYFFSTKTETLLYDFNLHVGDTIFKNEGYRFYSSLLSSPVASGRSGVDSAWVYRIDSILLPHDGRFHKRFHFKAKFHPWNQSYDINSDSTFDFKDLHVRIKINPLIEGIGPEYYPVSISSGFEYALILSMYCLSIDGKTVYKNPNPGMPATLFMNDILCNSVLTDVNEENLEDAITVYPQPCNGRFKLESKLVEKNVIEIYNVLGVTVFKSLLETETTDIDLTCHKPGIYFIRVSDKEKYYIQKLIYEK